MKKLLLVFLLLPAWSGYSQKNPKIDKLLATQDAQNPQQTATTLKKAEKYYRMGGGARPEALHYYKMVHKNAPSLAALNYKMAVCYLQSTTPQKALAHLQACQPNVAKDYYLQLGYALMHNLDYNGAKEAFAKYKASLGWCKTRTFNQPYGQLQQECEFGATAVKDSLPYFIIPLGLGINTVFPDYSAAQVNTPTDTAIYFTSRRPIDEPRSFKPYTKYKERLLVAPISNGRISDEINEPKVFQTSKNVSLAGYSPKEDKVFYYLGKHQYGNISSATLKDGKYKKVKPLHGKVNHLAFKETSFTQDTVGTAYFVSNRRGGEGGKDIYSCKKTGKNRYRKVRNMGPAINTPFTEEGVQVSADGKTLYFSSNGHKGMGGFDVYRTTKLDNGQWSAPVNLGYPINSPADELFYRTTADSLVALLSTIRPDAIGFLDIYQVKKDIRIPFELSGTVTHDKSGKPLNATVTLLAAKDQKTLTSAKNDTTTGLYLINMDNTGKYLAQADVAGYKSVTLEVPMAKVRHDKVKLDFALEKLRYPITISGTVTNRVTAKPIGAQILFKGAMSDSVLHRAFANAETGIYTITFDDKANFVMEVLADGYETAKEVLMLKKHSSDKATLDVAMTPLVTASSIFGKVMDKDSKQPIVATVNILKVANGQPMGFAKADSTGRYSVSVEDKGPFTAEVSAEGYFFASIPVAFTGDSTSVERNIELQKMKQGVKIVIENILFDTGKSTLLPRSFKELDKLANLLIENPTVRIEVSGHTDNVGSAASNKKLSKARALSVKNYLNKKGVPAENVEYEGYGSEQPIADNNTKEGKAQNRRVEVKVLAQ